MQKLLIIGTVWPEPDSSAAGSRMMQLINLFLENNWKITFASAAVTNDHMANLKAIGVSMVPIQLNDSSFDKFIKQLQPDCVIYDRFMTEEQFGWRVTDQCPNAIRILNTEDLHSLRKTRQQCLKAQKGFTISSLLNNEVTYREIASIYRSDLSLLISDFEINLLQDSFQTNPSLLFYLPFLLNPITPTDRDNWPDFSSRKHFVTIGNFRHEPNWDSYVYLKKEIWPLIKKELPEAELHVYGAYPPPKAAQLHNPSEGFHIKGWVKDAKKVMRHARICLSPLRFGAGIKGKLVEAMLCGTPSITTSIGAEGILNEEADWNGFVIDNPSNFAKAAIKLYTEESIWNQSQQNGIEIVNTRFKKDKFDSKLINCVNTIQSNLSTHRSNNFIGNMLNHHSLRSTEFMSRWIEEKNKNKNT